MHGFRLLALSSGSPHAKGPRSGDHGRGALGPRSVARPGGGARQRRTPIRFIFRWRTSRPANFRPLIATNGLQQTGSESTRFLGNAFVHQLCCNGLCATHGFQTPLAGRLGDKRGKDKGAVRPSNAKRVGCANQISAMESVHTSRWNFRIQRVHISHKNMHEFVPAIF